MAGFSCDLCKKTFRIEADLDRHKLDAHAFGADADSGEPESENAGVVSGVTSWTSLRSLGREALDVFVSPSKKNSVEREMLKIMLMTLVALAVLGWMLFMFFSRLYPRFVEHYGLLLAYLGAGLVVISATIWHLKAYRNVSCQTGMMVGMTVGMLSGFWVGLIVGATNGMFVGSVAGLAVGVFVGSWCGKCSGVMGILEGQMAGFMAGPMGAMTSVMMIADNFLWFIPIALVVIAAILFGLMFMLFKENAGQELNVARKQAQKDFFLFFGANIVVLIALAWLMAFGPKSPLFTLPLN